MDKETVALKYTDKEAAVVLNAIVGAVSLRGRGGISDGAILDAVIQHILSLAAPSGE